MNLHIFLFEPVNYVHKDHDAHTVRFVSWGSHHRRVFSLLVPGPVGKHLTPENLGKCCMCSNQWTAAMVAERHALVEFYEHLGKCCICSCQWTTDKQCECRATRWETALLECHKSSWSALSCCTVLTADAPVPGSSHFLVCS